MVPVVNHKPTIEFWAPSSSNRGAAAVSSSLCSASAWAVDSAVEAWREFGFPQSARAAEPKTVHRAMIPKLAINVFTISSPWAAAGLWPRHALHYAAGPKNRQAKQSENEGISLFFACLCNNRAD